MRAACGPLAPPFNFQRPNDQRMNAIILDNLLSPAVLFFALGLAAALMRSTLHIPDAMSRSLTLFLLIAIGFKGGTVIADDGIGAQVWGLMLAGIGLSFSMPLLGYWMLRRATRLPAADAAAVAAHYGSVSVVTFMAAVSYLQLRGAEFSGHMVALMVLMEIPAVLTGIWLARRALPLTTQPAQDSPERSLHVLNDGSILLLIGGLLIGCLARGEGREQLQSFLLTPLYGVLSLFLLDLGLKAGRQLRKLGSSGFGLPAFGLLMPLVGGLLALSLARILGLSAADATLLCVLAASASYIVVPAALQVAVPQADVVTGTTLSMSITFPFNIIVGIPLYYGAAQIWTMG